MGQSRAILRSIDLQLDDSFEKKVNNNIHCRNNDEHYVIAEGAVINL